jgi:hypothetical protein
LADFHVLDLDVVVSTVSFHPFQSGDLLVLEIPTVPQIARGTRDDG